MFNSNAFRDSLSKLLALPSVKPGVTTVSLDPVVLGNVAYLLARIYRNVRMYAPANLMTSQENAILSDRMRYMDDVVFDIQDGVPSSHAYGEIWKELIVGQQGLPAIYEPNQFTMPAMFASLSNAQVWDVHDVDSLLETAFVSAGRTPTAAMYARLVYNSIPGLQGRTISIPQTDSDSTPDPNTDTYADPDSSVPKEEKKSGSGMGLLLLGAGVLGAVLLFRRG